MTDPPAARSGVVKLWGLPDCRLEERGALRGHTERVTGVAFHPKAGKEAGCNQVASCGADTKVRPIDLYCNFVG